MPNHGAGGKTSKPGGDDIHWSSSEEETNWCDICDLALQIGPDKGHQHREWQDDRDECDPLWGTGPNVHIPQSAKLPAGASPTAIDKCDSVRVEPNNESSAGLSLNDKYGPLLGIWPIDHSTAEPGAKVLSSIIFCPSRVTEFGHPGRNYLKTSPLSSQEHISSSDSAAITILNDVCSNVSLMDAGVFRSSYPASSIDTSHRLDIRGIGSSSSIGHCRIPIWIEGSRHEKGLPGTYALIEMTVEVHFVENFGHQLLLGLDTLKDYGVDFLVTKNTVTMSCGEFTYPVSSVNTKFRSVLVRARDDVVIPGCTCKCILVTSHMLPGMDYLFEPNHFL